MKLALGQMHIPAPVFWKMSMREWMAAVEGYRAKVLGPNASMEPLDRDSLEEMMKDHPDARDPA